MRSFAALLLSASLACAEGERAGDFDYYVLSLSWSPTFCALEGEARGNPQCDRPLGWVLHGLWPQYDTPSSSEAIGHRHGGWPSFCRTTERNPSRAETAAMADIMGSSGSAWHQWKKHGRCSGLSSDDYFALSRLAYDAERTTSPIDPYYEDEEEEPIDSRAHRPGGPPGEATPGASGDDGPSAEHSGTCLR